MSYPDSSGPATIDVRPSNFPTPANFEAVRALTPNERIATHKEGPSSLYFSNSYQQLFVTTTIGQKFTIAFTASADADYALGAGITQANHYGILRFAVDGVPLTTYDPATEEEKELQFDSYNPTSRASYANLGGKSLTAGSHTLTVEVIGKNPASINYLNPTTGISDNGYAFGLDYLRLTPMS